MTDRTENNFSENLNKTFADAEKLAAEHGSSYIGSEHLLCAMLSLTECAAYKVLSAQMVSAEEYRENFIRTIDKKANIAGYTPRTKYIIERAAELGETVVRTDHLLLAIMGVADCIGIRILKCMGVDFAKLAKALEISVKSGDER